MTDPFGEKLVFEGCIPLSWTILQSEQEVNEYLARQEFNDEVLIDLVSLEDYQTDLSTENAHLAQELRRFESKLNIIISQLDKLISIATPRVSKYHVHLNSQAVQWVENNKELQIEHGQYVGVEAYLHSQYPRPLVMLGKVVQLKRQEQGTQVIVKLTELPGTTQNALDKFIFRSHRREIARRRHQKH